jgi:hypothetical protein
MATEKEVTGKTTRPAGGMAQLAVKEGEIIVKAEDASAVEAGLAQQDQAGEYIAPVVEKVDGQEDKPEQQEQAAPAAPAIPPAGPIVKADAPNDEANLETPAARVASADMTNANGTAVTNIMMARLAKHLKHLRGELGFADTKAQHEEQVTFMETVGNSTSLDYDEFKLVTDALVRAIIENKELFRSGDALRFIRGLAGKYPQDSINRYEAYITFLTKVATNWNSRHHLGSRIDIAFVIQHMKNVGKQNVTKYFNSLVAAK